MMQLVYKIIYNKSVNPFLRRLNKLALLLLPIKVKIPPSGSIKIKISHDTFISIKTNQTSFITHLLYWEGGPSCFEYTDIFLSLIKKVSVFYDIGANIGYYSLLASKENKDMKIVSFEPAIGSLHFLRENVRINSLPNIQVEPIALSHQEKGEIDFYEVKNSKYQYLKYNLAGEGNAGSKTKGREFIINKVQTTTLDNFVKSKIEKEIDLIKMDTEGTENLILEKSDFVLREMKPIVICETLYNTIEAELESIFKEYGYDFYCHVEEGLKKQNTIVRREDDGIRNCFFVHPSKYHLIEEYVIS